MERVSVCWGCTLLTEVMIRRLQGHDRHKFLSFERSSQHCFQHGFNPRMNCPLSDSCQAKEIETMPDVSKNQPLQSFAATWNLKANLSGFLKDVPVDFSSCGFYPPSYYESKDDLVSSFLVMYLSDLTESVKYTLLQETKASGEWCSALKVSVNLPCKGSCDIGHWINRDPPALIFTSAFVTSPQLRESSLHTPFRSNTFFDLLVAIDIFTVAASSWTFPLVYTASELYPVKLPNQVIVQ
eukprot:746912-Hanusia_phi.AAC.4